MECDDSRDSGMARQFSLMLEAVSKIGLVSNVREKLGLRIERQFCCFFNFFLFFIFQFCSSILRFSDV